MFDSQLTQYIITDKAGSHEDTVYAVALASALNWLYYRDLDSWVEFLQGAFTKIVRRGTSSEVLKAFTSMYDVVGQDNVFVHSGDSLAYSFPPIPKALMPPEMGKLQVADFEKPRLGWDEVWTRSYDDDHVKVGYLWPTLIINGGLDMSTGKAAAQASHALMAWLLKHKDDEELLEEFDENPKFKIIEYNAKDFAKALEDEEPVVKIVDAGRTEIAPGSCTVIVYD